MSDPIIGSAKAAVAGIREALAVGKEMDAVAKDIQDLGKADLQARDAFRRKQKQRPKDTAVFSAAEEWRGVYEIRKLEESLKEEIISKHGAAAWEEVQVIKNRILADNKELTDEFGRDIRKLTLLKWYCFLAAFFLVSFLYILGYKP